MTSGGGAAKLARGHPDDGVARAVDDDRLADDVGDATKAALPGGVADHRDRVRQLPHVLRGNEHAPARRPHAEHAEVVGRYHLGHHPLRLTVSRNAQVANFHRATSLKTPFVRSRTSLQCGMELEPYSIAGQLR